VRKCCFAGQTGNGLWGGSISRCHSIDPRVERDLNAPRHFVRTPRPTRAAQQKRPSRVDLPAYAA